MCLFGTGAAAATAPVLRTTIVCLGNSLIAARREMHTPGPAGSALLTSPPPSVHPRRSRLSTMHRPDASVSDEEEALDARYGNTLEEDDGLASLSMSQRRMKTSHLGRSKQGRHSVAGGGPSTMTLREQEQVRHREARLMVECGRIAEGELQPAARESLSERTTCPNGA